MSEATSEAAVESPIGKVSFKGRHVAEFIAIMCLCLLFVLAYVVWEHKADAKEGMTQLAGAIKEMTVAQRQNVEAQREMNCLIAMSPDKREREFMAPNSLCKTISRER